MSKTAREIPRFADCGAQQNRYRFAKVRAGSADNLSARQWFLLASLSESRTRSRFVKASIENRREPQRPVVRVSEKLAYIPNSQGAQSGAGLWKPPGLLFVALRATLEW